MVVKLLGVLFDRLLPFDAHVDICRKAGGKLCVLPRLSKTLDTESKLILFHTFVLSHFLSTVQLFGTSVAGKK